MSINSTLQVSRMESPSLTYLKELSKGNVVFERKIIKIMIDELGEENAFYEKAIQLKNYYWASEIVHKMKHKIAFFQMDLAFSVAEEHELSLLKESLNYDKDFQEIITKILNFLPECSE